MKCKYWEFYFHIFQSGCTSFPVKQRYTLIWTRWKWFDVYMHRFRKEKCAWYVIFILQPSTTSIEWQSSWKGQISQENLEKDILVEHKTQHIP